LGPKLLAKAVIEGELEEIGHEEKSPAARQIRAIRTRSRISQAVFAAVLNTGVSTVQKCEIGEKRPSGPSLKLLNVIQRKCIAALS